MDPQLKSILTSVLLAIATAATTWGVAQGVIPAADQNVIANDLVTALLAGGAAAVAYWKSRQHTPTAEISAVNSAPNGVKVVAATSPSPTVTAPILPQAPPPNSSPKSLLIFAALALAATLLNGGRTARADSQDLLAGIAKQHNWAAPGSAPTPAPTNDLIGQVVAANKAELASLQTNMAQLLSLFGTGDGAISESQQYPDLIDGNGHDCAIQGKRFTQVIHDHPLILTGDFIDDLQNLRTVSAAAQKVCNASSCQAVFGDLSAQVSKSVSAVNAKVGAVTSIIPGVGTVGGAVSAIGSAASSINVFSLLCGDIATISLVPPAIADTPLPTPSSTPTPTPTAK